MLVELYVTAETVVEDSEVDTEVIGHLLFPLQVLDLYVILVGGCLVHISASVGITAVEQVLGIWLLTYDTPSRAQGEHRQPREGGGYPWLLADVPTH